MNRSPEVSQLDWLAEYPPPRSLPLDQEALRIYEHAYHIGLKCEEEGTPPVTFTTVMAALLVGDDATSRWFADLAKENGPDVVTVLAEKKLTFSTLPQTSGKPDEVRLSKDKHLLTASARSVMENAERWAQRVRGSDIGVRHFVASYVLNPPQVHRAQMQRWKFQESKWRPAFFEWVAKWYTAEEWTDASYRPAPTKAVPIFEQQKVKGSELAFPGDQDTLAVLEKAATFHARIEDQWLGLQTVFYALVESAREDLTLRAAITPIWDAIQLVDEQYTQARDKFIPAASSPDNVTSFSSLDISPRVLNVLETARELAVATRIDNNAVFRVHVLHLAGALVSRRVDGDQQLAALGLNPQQLRLAFIQYAHQHGQSIEVWRESLGEEESLHTGRPVDLNSDEPEAVVRLDEDWKTDPLSIRPDVEAFAALLAAKSLQPPLSIGLFGPWGSGKTTFLKRLKRAVERRAGEAKKSTANNEPTAYVSNVVHVDFNAWHFAEDALTSSLVDTILRALGSYIKEDKTVAGKSWSEVKLEALETTKRKVQAAAALEEAAERALVKAEKALVSKEAEAVEKTTSLGNIVQTAWKVALTQLRKSSEVKDSGVLDSIGETVKSADELETRLNMVRTRPTRILGDLGWSRSLLFAGLVLAVPPLIGWAVGKLLEIGQAAQLLSSLTAVLAVIGVWARAAAGAVSKVDKAITQVADSYAEKVASDPDVQNAQKTLTVAQANAATAASGVLAAREALARAQAEVANASLPAQMLQLVTSRIEDQSYQKELTTLSLARADLESLSLILRAQQNETPTANDATAGGDQPSPPIRVVDRVVLYIDDLDRCKPADVVRVLQLVHMLLAFELFVVVVAVDARWVEEALIDSYHWLAGNEANGENGGSENRGAGRVTPQDYLEKIFQISFWLEPMTSARAASYLGSLVRAPERDFSPTGAEPLVPVTGKIDIAGIELDYMRALAAYVGPSPRRVKRLVNAYRLIKARMSDAQLNTFLDNRATTTGELRSGPYQIVIGLLVIGTGAPATSAKVLRELAECDPRDSWDDVVDRFQKRNDSDWSMAAKVIETVMRTQKANDVSELRGWARKVGRFLLNSPAADLRMNGGKRHTSAEDSQSETHTPVESPTDPEE